MSINQEVKQQVITLVQRGQRDQAKTLIMEKFQIASEDAEKLIQAVELENPVVQGIPPDIQEKMKLVSGQAGGCIVLGLRGLMVFFLIFTFVCYALAVGLLIYYNSYTGSAEHVTGTVTSFTENDQGSMAPVVEYTRNNEVKKYTSTMYSSPPDYQVGDQVTLLINPEKPDDVILDSFTERYMISTVLGGVGTFFLIFSLGLLVISRKIKRSLANSQ